MRLFRTHTDFEKKIGYKFKDPALLKIALTHPSAAECESRSYQRLEFLGDALLSFVVGEWLFKKYTTSQEGDLTEMRRILVNCETLSKIARVIGIEQDVIADYSEHGIGANTSIMCDVYEAIVAAIYIDGGMSGAEHFIERTLLSHSETLFSASSSINFKGKLLEHLQSRGQHPHYRVLEADGPPHRITFKIGAYLGSELLGIGIGFNKKEAEQEAAKRALEKLNK
jgi:ribonuclease III